MCISDRIKPRKNSQNPTCPLILEQSKKMSPPPLGHTPLSVQDESAFNNIPNPNDNNSNTIQKNSFFKSNLLDPHLSFLQYLETSELTNEQEELIEHQIPLCSNKSIAGVSSSKGLGGNIPISDSWHNIEKSQLFEEDLKFETNSIYCKNNNVGILSSTDTSSEEEPQYEPFAPSLLTVSNLKGKTTHSQIISHQEISLPSTSLPNPVNMLSVSENNIQDIILDKDLNTNNIVTQSLSSSSNSFIMPKLVFEKKTSSLNFTFNKPWDKKNYILILGRYGLQFFKSIPFEYQKFFQLPASHDPKDFEQYHGLIIIVKELRELITLLNRVSKLEDGGPPLIILYYKDQRVQVKNIIKSFLRKRLITLYYPPIDINNDQELDNLFHLIKLSLSNEKPINKDVGETQPHFVQTSCKSFPLSFDNQDNSISQLKTRKKRNEQKPNQLHRKPNVSKKKQNGDRSKNYKGSKKSKPKRWFHYFSNKWIKWGLSISVGASAVYYIKRSYYINKESIPFVKAILDTKIFSRLKNSLIIKVIATLFQNVESKRIDQQEYSAASIPVYGTTGTNVKSTLKPMLDYCYNFIKYPIVKVNNFIKNTIVSATKGHNIHLEQLNKINNWSIEDSNNFITLSYITI